MHVLLSDSKIRKSWILRRAVTVFVEGVRVRTAPPTTTTLALS